MNMKLLTLLVFLVATLASGRIKAQSEPPSDTEKGSFSVTVNPAFYILGGYSAKGFYHLPKKWSLGVAAEASFELPDFSRDQFFDNNGNVDVHWDYLVGIEARYRFNDSNIDQGFYLAGTLGYEGWTITSDTGAEDSFDNWYSSLGVGYNWYPFRQPHFHVGAAYSIIFILNNAEDRLVGDTNYNIRPVVPPSVIPTLYLGWRF